MSHENVVVRQLLICHFEERSGLIYFDIIVVTDKNQVDLFALIIIMVKWLFGNIDSFQRKQLLIEHVYIGGKIIFTISEQIY